jgi:hypothetical protein
MADTAGRVKAPSTRALGIPEASVMESVVSKPPVEVTITLEPCELVILNGPWAGGGGFQGLAPKLQAKTSANGALHLVDEEIGAIIRHMSYAQSGFRDRVRKVFRRSMGELMNRK